MTQASPQYWNRLARLLHWGTALAILIEVPAGFAMAWTYFVKGQEDLHLRASQVHHTVGFLLLATVIVRIAWRIRHRGPDLPSDLGAGRRRAARAVQYLLLALLLAIPLSGWASLSSMAAGAGYPAPPIWFLGHNGNAAEGLIPHIVSPKPWNAAELLTYGNLAKAHRWLLIAGGVLLSIHIGAALWHHFVRRDGVLRSMTGQGAG